MRNKTKLIIVFLILALPLNSQNIDNFCGTYIPADRWEIEFQKLITDLRTNLLQRSNNQPAEYTIPVIFHIIHGGQPIGTFPNILQQQVVSQITVLNQDFLGTGLNSGNYPVNAFINWAINQNLPQINLDSLGRVKIANINIKFCLAEKDTSGNTLPEPGINRINYISIGWLNPNTFTTPPALRSYFDGVIKPASIWNAKKYLNIWISDKNPAVQFTGFATLPPLSTLPGISGGTGTDSTDGIWCYVSATGSSTLFPGGFYASQNVKGRTITHEAGHYLGLRHIWADGNCLNDYCTDTPPAFTSNTGFPVYPHNPGTCNNPSNSPNGEMFMNFMDYSADPAKYMFTYDQSLRMQTAMAFSPLRVQLGTHNLCQAVIAINTEETQIPSGYELYQNYPNPFNPSTNISFSLPEKSEVIITVYDANGAEVATIINKILPAGSHEVEWNAAEFPSGIYFLRLNTSKINISRKMVLVR